MPELKSITIGRKAITFVTEINAGNTDPEIDSEVRTTTAKAEPLASFTKAFDALRPVATNILETEDQWQHGVTVEKLTISRTKHGTRSVKLRLTKQLDSRTDLLHRIDTPFVQVDKPADGESGEVQVEPKHQKAILKAIQEAEAYADGKRSQSLFSFEDAKKTLQATADIGQANLGFGG